MNIRFTSSLTAEDENRLASVLVQTLGTILNALPIAYLIRIDTSDSHVYQASGAGVGAPADRREGWRIADGVIGAGADLRDV